MTTVTETTLAVESDEDWFRRWRDRELARLDANGVCYLDYTGAALYPASLVRADASRLEARVHGNPHSEHLPSRQSSTDLDGARQAILDFLGAPPAEYVVALTPNASGACRLVGEAYPFGPDRPLVLTADNHNSMNGIREFARRAGNPFSRITLDKELRLIDPAERLREAAGRRGGLFGFPAQSNFSGVRHPLSLVPLAQELGYRVLVDAAAFLPTARIDFEICRPDFVALVYPGWNRAMDITAPKDAAPAFLTSAGKDDASHAVQTVDFYNSLFKVGVPVELHIYSHGGHGKAIHPRDGIPFGAWHIRLQDWMSDLGLLKP